MKHCSNPECDHLVRFGRISEFTDMIATCSDCGSALAWGEAPVVEQQAEYRDLVTVYESSDHTQAHLIRSLLEDAGIQANVGGDSLQGAMGEIPLTMLSLRVQVSPVDEARAREWISEAEGTEP